KVNKKLVPMGYVLQNGDQIQVTTSKNQKPTEDWLKLVITSRARSQIKSAIKEEKKRIGELGKEALVRKFRKLKLEFEQNIDQVVDEPGYDSRIDLYYDIARDKVSIQSIFKKIDVEDGEILHHGPKEKPTSQPQQISPRKLRKKTEKSIILLNEEPGEKFQYSFANCCNPVNGDNIFGFITTKEGIKIHRYNCPNAPHLLSNYGYRIMKADWANNLDKEFVADLKIVGIDQGVGVIQNLTRLISNKFNLNIRSFHIEGEEGYYEAKISLLVHNTNQLQLIIKSLNELDGISSVRRIE